MANISRLAKRMQSIRTLKKEHWFHPDGFPIAVERRDPQEPFGLHSHEFSEMVVITGGSGLHVTGRDSWNLSAGDVFVIGSLRPHDYRDMHELQLINVLFDPKQIQFDRHDLTGLPGYHALFKLEPEWRQRHQFNSRLHLPPHDLTAVAGLIDRLDAELKRREPGFACIASAIFMQIAGFLSRCYNQSKHPDSRALLRIAEAISLLESNYYETISLDELANTAHMSKRSFIRTFQAAMGASPIAYLIQQRINKAAALLRRSDASITEIALRVGFDDSNYFARQFRKALGTSPRLYRKQHQSPDAQQPNLNPKRTQQ